MRRFGVFLAVVLVLGLAGNAAAIVLEGYNPPAQLNAPAGRTLPTLWSGITVPSGQRSAPINAATVTHSYGPFDVVFHNTGDSNGFYTGVANWTAQQMADVAASIAAWDNLIANEPGRQIVAHLFWDDLGSGVLGGSISSSYGDGTTSWTYPEHIWRDGVNYSGDWTEFDTLIVLNNEFSWNFGDGSPSGSEVDFRSVVTHEFGHSIGFNHTYYHDPYYDWGNTWGTSEHPHLWAGFRGLSRWCENLVDSNGNVPENAGQGTPAFFDAQDDPVYWTGAVANALHGDPVPIYAPTTFSGGSSLSHLDWVSGALMNPAIGYGWLRREPIPVEVAMLEDMGWTLQQPAGITVTEMHGGWPTTWEFVSPDILEVDKTATGFGPFDMEIQVTGGMESIAIEEIVLNDTLQDWPGYHIQLGYWVSDEFVLSDDGLAFAGGEYSLDGVNFFPLTALSDYELFYGDTIGAGSDIQFVLNVDLPSGADPFSFALRQYAVPEPGSAVLLVLSALVLLAFGRWRGKE